VLFGFVSCLPATRQWPEKRAVRSGNANSLAQPTGRDRPPPTAGRLGFSVHTASVHAIEPGRRGEPVGLTRLLEMTEINSIHRHLPNFDQARNGRFDPAFYQNKLPHEISMEGCASHVITGQLIVPF
jgi:hypothetical protein